MPHHCSHQCRFHRRNSANSQVLLSDIAHLRTTRPVHPESSQIVFVLRPYGLSTDPRRPHQHNLQRPRKYISPLPLTNRQRAACSLRYNRNLYPHRLIGWHGRLLGTDRDHASSCRYTNRYRAGRQNQSTTCPRRSAASYYKVLRWTSSLPLFQILQPFLRCHSCQRWRRGQCQSSSDKCGIFRMRRFLHHRWLFQCANRQHWVRKRK